MVPAAEWKKDQETLKRIHESNASNVLYDLKAKEDEYEVMFSIYLTPISYNLKANTKALYKLEEEREHLINIAKPHTKNSTVVDSVTGKSKNRYVPGTFLDRGQDETVQAIEIRISDFTFLHVGQKYEPHYDYFLDDYNTKSGGQRMATLLMYLNIAWDKVENQNPQSTPQVPPSFEETTPPMTYPKEVEKNLETPIEVEPLNEVKLKEVGLNCNHNTPLSYREVPNFDKPETQPQPLPNCPPLDASPGTERGLKPPIKPQSPNCEKRSLLRHVCRLERRHSNNV
nr:probable prolyl 4-hydroxylase 10 [Tanacetum cinerariifolium]